MFTLSLSAVYLYNAYKQFIFSRYDFNDPMLQRVACFAPDAAMSHRARDSTPSLLTLALLLPRIVDRNDKDKLQAIDDQWRALPFAAEKFPDEIKGCKDPATFWHKVRARARARESVRRSLA